MVVAVWRILGSGAVCPLLTQLSARSNAQCSIDVLLLPLVIALLAGLQAHAGVLGVPRPDEKETGDDIRLSVRLFNKCLGDFQRFCKDVEPGHMRVQECLEDNLEESAFSSECKEELENQIAKRVTDFRLDTALREACESDLKDVCGRALEEMDNDDKVKKTALNCLQQYNEELKSEKCKAEVHRRISRQARDIRFDEVLANACYEDRSKFCNDVQPVSGWLTGRLWGCAGY